MRKLSCLISCLLLIVLFGSRVVQAQSTKQAAPLIIVLKGDLFAWDGATTKQLTKWGYNSDPILSPDGKSVAYKSLPQFVVDDIKKNGGRSGFPPSNFWVMDIATGDATRIADQPSDAHFADLKGDEKFTTRPQPVWSPDSKALAWGEIVGSKTDANGSWAGYEQHLVIYDLAKKKLQILVQDMPAEDGISEGSVVDWGERGLAYIAFKQDVPVLFIYDLQGKQLAQYTINPDKGSVPISAVWIKDTILIKCDPVSKSFLVDPDTGDQSPLPGKLEVYSTAAPAGIRLYYDNGWNIDDPDNGTQPVGEAVQIAISPDGKQVIYTAAQDGETTYHQYQNGSISPFPLVESQQHPGGFVWTPLVMDIRH